MKKGLLLCVLFLLVAAYPLAGEEILARRLSVSFRETPLKQALDEVARLANFEWSYNARILDSGRRVSLSATDWTVREILREMLGDEFGYKSNGQYLILKKQNPPKSEISGVIRATKSGERLANVTVYDRKTLRATTTDSSGYYQLKVKKQTDLIVVRHGYRDTMLQVVSLSPRYQNLNLTPIPIQTADSSSSTELLRESLRKAATELDYFFNATLNKWNDLNVPDTLRRRFQISLLPKIGTNHVLSGKVENDWSINLLAGQSAGVGYFEGAGLGNFTRKHVRGFQAAGLFNVNRGNCTGVQAAGLFNQTADTLTGVQLAGLINVARQSPHFSVQAAGLLNIIRESTGPDSSKTAPKSIQLAGLLNTSNEITGVQAAGLMNTARDINGVQVAGLLNRAKRIHGVQIGIINSADELQGLQIGLLNRSGKRWLPFVNWHQGKTAGK